jgi:hypothetical protein
VEVADPDVRVLFDLCDSPDEGVHVGSELDEMGRDERRATPDATDAVDGEPAGRRSWSPWPLLVCSSPSLCEDHHR